MCSSIHRVSVILQNSKKFFCEKTQIPNFRSFFNFLKFSKFFSSEQRHREELQRTSISLQEAPQPLKQIHNLVQLKQEYKNEEEETPQRDLLLKDSGQQRLHPVNRRQSDQERRGEQDQLLYQPS